MFCCKAAGYNFDVEICFTLVVMKLGFLQTMDLAAASHFLIVCLIVSLVFLFFGIDITSNSNIYIFSKHHSMNDR